MKRSIDRMLTTHVGSLPRPPELLELMATRESGQPYDGPELDRRVSDAVTEAVRQQAEVGVDVVSDGEMGKMSFVYYVRNRIAGMEGVNSTVRQVISDYPGYDEWRAAQVGARNTLPGGMPACVGPLGWKDRAELDRDIANFKAALQTVSVEEAFMPAASIGIIAQRMANRYYDTYEHYVEAIAGVMRDEYQAISDVGLLLQVDAPEMAMDKNTPEFQDVSMSDYLKRVGLWVDALNHALEGIPEDRIRLHICWGNHEAPHSRDIGLRDIIDVMLRVNAGAYCIEASNPRHAHEWSVWKDVKLPEGKVLIPGVLDTTTNFIEHPELIAERLVRFAEVVGRENVIAGSDCGFATMAFRRYMVYPPAVFGKLRAMAEGAEIATKRLWH